MTTAADQVMQPADHHWVPMDESPGPVSAVSPHNGSNGNAMNGDGGGAPHTPTRDRDHHHANGGSPRVPGHKSGTIYREKQIKANKVYVGGLPENTRQEDLQNCFGKLGNILSIELKLGYGFVEFETREAAEESVSKYHEGYFMGNKIRVELSHGGGKTAKFAGEPGACFKCGLQGHWARECPNHVVTVGPSKKAGPENSLLDRLQPRDGGAPRDYSPYNKDDYNTSNTNRTSYGAPPPPRDRAYSGGPGQGPGYYPPPRDNRDFRRPPSPPRDFRDYNAGAPPAKYPREDDYYRRDYRGPPPAHAPPQPRDGGYYAPDYEARDGYSRPGYGPPPAHAPPRDYDRRGPPAGDRYAYAGPPGPPRPRTPPPPHVARRDEYERPPPRDFYPPPPGDYRGRPGSPQRYGDYPPPRNGAAADRFANGPPPPRRRSASPRNGAYRPYPNDAPPDPAGYAPNSGGPSYGPPGGYSTGNGYPSPTGGAAPATPISGSAPIRGGANRTQRDDRDYSGRPPPAVDRRESAGGDLAVGGQYHRRA